MVAPLPPGATPKSQNQSTDTNCQSRRLSTRKNTDSLGKWTAPLWHSGRSARPSRPNIGPRSHRRALRSRVEALSQGHGTSAPRRVIAAAWMSALGRLTNAYGCHRYTVLFYSLLFTLAIAPLLTAFGFSGDLLQIFLAFNLLIALLGVAGRRWRTLLVLVVAIAVGLRAAPASTVGAGLATAALVAGGGLALLTVGAAMRFALRAPRIDGEHIYAAL